MIFAGEDKALIRIFYRIIGYGQRKVIREFRGKGRKTFGLDNVITKLLNKGMCKCKRGRRGAAHRGLRLSLTSDANSYSA